MKYVFRPLLLLVGCVSLVLGILGIFLPVLPTTPFVLLSALCFSKSSPALHSWLMSTPYLGNIIRDWQQNRSISPRAKVTCVILIVLTMSYSIFSLDIPIPARLGMALVGISVSTFVLTRKTTATRTKPKKSSVTDVVTES